MIAEPITNTPTPASLRDEPYCEATALSVHREILSRITAHSYYVDHAFLERTADTLFGAMLAARSLADAQDRSLDDATVREVVIKHLSADPIIANEDANAIMADLSPLLAIQNARIAGCSVEEWQEFQEWLQAGKPKIKKE